MLVTLWNRWKTMPRTIGYGFHPNGGLSLALRDGKNDKSSLFCPKTYLPESEVFQPHVKDVAFLLTVGSFLLTF